VAILDMGVLDSTDAFQKALIAIEPLAEVRHLFLLLGFE